MVPIALSPDQEIANGTHGTCDVCIVGAGPAGLMLADNLARFGLNCRIIDERPNETSAGRADGLQPKTIETLQMLRLGDDLIRVSTKVYDICIWGQTNDEPLKRVSREIHYPQDIVDVLHPYILLCHQGMVENTFIESIRQRGCEVQRSTRFETYQQSKDGTIHIKASTDHGEEVIHSKYLVGCDGAHSKVRKAVPGMVPEGSSSESVWGVLDGELETNFPDIWSKSIVFHPQHGSILIIPRERSMTRLYIELKADTETGSPVPADIGSEAVMERARQICSPFEMEWKSVEWFGRYQIGQRVANKFMDDSRKVFIAGDASHTHSPKAAQGMNTSIHDSWNLGWKLNLELRGLAKPSLLQSYESERRKIAQDLINFDYEHANQIAAGDSEALAENFRKNLRFISGVGVEYDENILTKFCSPLTGDLRPGSILPPAKILRYIDHNPVDVQLDIPILGQFRIYVVVPDVVDSSTRAFLEKISDHILNPSSFMGRITKSSKKSYAEKPRVQGKEDVFFRHERYLGTSDIFTMALITQTNKQDFEIDQLPLAFSQSPWTVYLDSVPNLDTRGELCISKWMADMNLGEVAIVNVRPDNYVGTISRWNSCDSTSVHKAGEWLDSFYSGFLQA